MNKLLTPSWTLSYVRIHHFVTLGEFTASWHASQTPLMWSAVISYNQFHHTACWLYMPTEEGVVGGCSALCSVVQNKTGSQPVGAVCDILCDLVGVQEFSKLIDKYDSRKHLLSFLWAVHWTIVDRSVSFSFIRIDLDPILYCEALTLCKINDNGDAKITNLTVSPQQGPPGTKFQVTSNSQDILCSCLFPRWLV